MAGEARKHDDGKPRYDLIDWGSVDALARVMTFGSLKYDDRNYLGLEPERVQASLGRHYSAYMRGEDYDPETGEPHLAHVMANSMMLMEIHRHREAAGLDA